MNRGKVWLRRLEVALLTAGLILLAVFIAVKVQSQISSRLAVKKFEAEQSAALQDAEEFGILQTRADVDLRLWSDSRIKDYLESLESVTDTPPALLRIPKLHLEVPIYEGSDERTLNRGLGRIIGTARLGEPGNTGIAGHRDGFFRGLKDLGPGDTLELMLPHRTDHYIVTNILITNPDDVSVLQPSSIASLTLVTCYPFYFVGSAPKRYIVQATFGEPALASGEPTNQVQSRTLLNIKE
jgi:sortase A